MSEFTAVDVHGFGGGFTLGVVQAGFELTAKMSRAAGFGVYNTLANRHLLGDEWESHTGHPDEWPIVHADYVFGNPPCSGFSTLSRKDFRGTDSTINEYMWEVIRYAGEVRPTIVAWESVQQTFRQGLELMRQLHAELESISGLKYHLTHVLHNNLSHGGCSMRRRYFWVASQVPFGVESGRITRDGERALVDHVPTMGGALRDLERLGLTMVPQRYPTAATVMTGSPLERTHVYGSSTWCVREMHDGTGLVDGHDTYHSNTRDRVLELLLDDAVEWHQGENMATVMRRYYDIHGHLSPSWNYMTKKVDDDGQIVSLPKAERLIETDFAMGHNQPTRWRSDRPANVLTGGAVHLVVHPTQDRTLTHREVARIQGFPDDWHIYPVRDAKDVGPAWGKGVPVQAGRWVSYWAKMALEGAPGGNTGIPLEAYDKKLLAKYGAMERETIIDTTYDFRILE